MRLFIGDPVFNHLGDPAVVVKYDSPNELKVDGNAEQVRQDFRHGYLRGLDEGMRQEFYGIMDEVAGMKDPQEKVDKLQVRINELEREITPRAQQMLSYLKGELAHVLNSFHYAPRFYEIAPTRQP